jgi:hypothetical protein
MSNLQGAKLPETGGGLREFGSATLGLGPGDGKPARKNDEIMQIFHILHYAASFKQAAKLFEVFVGKGKFIK